MGLLAAEERYEEAALARDRLRALAEGLARARADGWLVGAGSIVLRDAEGNRVRFRGGALLRTDDEEPIPLPCPRDRADELAAVRSWLARNPLEVEATERPPAEMVGGGSVLYGILARLREPARRS
jgi:hypothetical protein